MRGRQAIPFKFANLVAELALSLRRLGCNPPIPNLQTGIFVSRSFQRMPGLYCTRLSSTSVYATQSWHLNLSDNAVESSSLISVGGARVHASGAVDFPRITRFVSTSSVRGYGSEADDEKQRRILNRILYRSRQRGYLELDLLLGKWAEENINALDEKRLQELVDLLEGENPDLWNWLTGQAEVPTALAENSVFTAIKDQIAVNLRTYSSPQTRAQPGRPWVRSWDDNRTLGGPQTGNQ